MKLLKIETYCISELKEKALHNALTWLDEYPIETENEKGKCVLNISLMIGRMAIKMK